MTLTTGEVLRFAGEILGDAQDLRGFGNALIDFVVAHLRMLEQAKRERHVLINREVRIESVVLEDHRDVAVFRLKVVNDDAVDFNGTFGDVFKTRDHAERGGFAAAGRSDEDDEFLILDG